MKHIKEIINNQGSIPPDQNTEIEGADLPTDLTIHCKLCNDAGRIHPLRTDGRPDWSKTIPCRACTPPEAVRRVLGVTSMDATLEKLTPERGFEDILRYAKVMVAMKSGWKLMMIYGGNGNGKTSILEGISIALWNQGYLARVEVYPDFMGRLRGSFNKSKSEDNGQSFEDIMNKICSTPFLLMDDIGIGDSFSDFSVKQLERIILARYRENIFTVMSTNRDLKELPLSVHSRFNDQTRARLLCNTAEDYRPKKVAR
jgi:DNA replication protein DnaC